MARPFLKLRARLAENGYTQQDMQRRLGLGSSTVSRRFNGVEEWRLTEIWEIMEWLDIPAQQMHEYFPKYGINEKGVKRIKPLKRLA